MRNLVKAFIPLLLFSLPLLWCAFANAQSTQSVSSAIDHVTVYRKGAQVTRVAETRLPAGETTLLFKGLPQQLWENSLSLRASGDVTVLSLSQTTDYLETETLDSLSTALMNQQLAIRDSISLLQRHTDVYQNERNMMLANQSIGGQEGVQAAELEQMATLFRERLFDIEEQLRQISLRTKDLQKRLLRVSKALLELNVEAEAPPTVTVKVKLQAERAQQSEIELQYVVPDAGWDPFYNLRIEDTQSPLSLEYKAKVFQDTEEDWQAVNLTLSTGNPYTSNVKPELNTYYLTFDNYYANLPQPAPYSASGERTVSGTVADENGEPLIGASILVKGTTQGVVTDMDGRFSLALPPGSSTLVISYVGYANQEVSSIRGGNMNIQLQPSNMMLDEVVITGSRSPRMRMEQRAPAKPQMVPLAVDKQYTSTAFEIEVPYSIPADNQPYDVHMISHDITAKYHYAVVPKLSDQAYLIAAVTDWAQYSLLSGSANLFFKGTYQGKTYLDMEAFEDTLSVSVGRDEDIIVKRERVKDKSSTSFLGSNKTVERVWKTTIRNTNDYPVELVVNDQYPIAKEDDIKVVQLEHDGGKLEEATGKVTWSFTLPAGATEERMLKYAVRYPKKRRLVVD
jgi:hypothetical protein